MRHLGPSCMEEIWLVERGGEPLIEELSVINLYKC